MSTMNNLVISVTELVESGICSVDDIVRYTGAPTSMVVAIMDTRYGTDSYATSDTSPQMVLDF